MATKIVCVDGPLNVCFLLYSYQSTEQRLLFGSPEVKRWFAIPACVRMIFLQTLLRYQAGIKNTVCAH